MIEELRAKIAAVEQRRDHARRRCDETGVARWNLELQFLEEELRAAKVREERRETRRAELYAEAEKRLVIASCYEAGDRGGVRPSNSFAGHRNR